MTQAEVASRTGLDQTGISRVEAGRQDVNTSQLLALAAALGTTAASLLGEIELPAVAVRTTYEVHCPDHGLVICVGTATEAHEHQQRHVRAHLRTGA
jgi:transcriptional regulator with XRE-family HTH domain